MITATVHPSSILRAPDPATREAEMAAFTEDLRMAGVAFVILVLAMLVEASRQGQGVVVAVHPPSARPLPRRR